MNRGDQIAALVLLIGDECQPDADTIEQWLTRAETTAAEMSR